MFLTHSDKALEIKKFKRSRENKIEFAYDYGNLNASYQTSSLKPYVPNLILEKIIIDLEDEVVNLLEKEKVNLETIESLKSKIFESSEKVCSESKNQSENDCLVVENECEKKENSKVIAPEMFKLNVSQSVSSISMSKSSCDSNNVEIKLKRKRRETISDFVCNGAMNVSCDSRMNDLLDDNNFFIFDGESVRISPVSKMPFSKKPCDSMNVRSKSTMNKSLPRTVHKWLPKLQPLAEPIAKWFPRRVGTDNGTEFKNKTLAKFFDEVGITQQFSAARTPQQNGIVERRNRNLVEAARTMLGCRCYLLNDYEDVGKLKAKGDIGIMESSTMNFETSNAEIPLHGEEVFHEVSESFQGESSSSSLNDDVQQSPGEDAYFDASTSFHDPFNVHTFYQPYLHEKKWTKDHPLHKITGDSKSSVRKRRQLANSCLFSCLLSSIEPANVAEALRDADWISAIQEELDQFVRLKVWRLVP
nr:hypothetical protein [Tanacetum cinerariifolium]